MMEQFYQVNTLLRCNESQLTKFETLETQNAGR